MSEAIEEEAAATATSIQTITGWLGHTHTTSSSSSALKRAELALSTAMLVTKLVELDLFKDISTEFKNVPAAVATANEMRAACMPLFDLVDKPSPPPAAPSAPAPAPAPVPVAAAAAAPTVAPMAVDRSKPHPQSLWSRRKKKGVNNSAAPSAPTASPAAAAPTLSGAAQNNNTPSATAAAPAATPAPQRPYGRPTPGSGPPPVPRHTRPLPRGTFASAVRKPAPAPTTPAAPVQGTSNNISELITLAKLFPDRSAAELSAMLKRGTKCAASPTNNGRASAKKPKSTTRGPTCKLIYIFVDATFSGNYESAVTLLNRRLAAGHCKLRVVHAVEDGDAILLHTDIPPNQQDLNTVRTAVQSDWFHSRHKVRAEFAASCSFLKIVNVPYLSGEPLTPITRDAIKARLEQDPLTMNFHLCGKPRVSRNKSSANMCTVWFEIWDSKRGSNKAQLVNQGISLAGKYCTILSAPIHAGTPQCQQCWV
jgi:hypothetical protein